MWEGQFGVWIGVQVLVGITPDSSTAYSCNPMLYASWPAEGTDDDPQHFAVGVHPGGRTKTVIGEAVSGSALVQIWSAPSETSSNSMSTTTALPEMQLGLWHQGGLTWDCKWCPCDTATQTNSTSSSSMPRYSTVNALLLCDCLSIKLQLVLLPGCAIAPASAHLARSCGPSIPLACINHFVHERLLHHIGVKLA